MITRYSADTIDAANDSIEATLGPAPTLELWDGPVPLTAAEAPTGTLLASLVLPSDFWSPSSNGVKIKQGAWTLTASAPGTVRYWRLLKTSTSSCKLIGDVTDAFGTGSVRVDLTLISATQQITVLSFNQVMTGIN